MSNACWCTACLSALLLKPPTGLVILSDWNLQMPMEPGTNEQTLGKSMLNPRMLNAGDSAQIMHFNFKTQIKCARKHACKPCCEPLGIEICFQFNDHVVFYRDLHNARTKKQRYICENLCGSYECCIQSTVSIMIKTKANSWCLGKASCLLYCMWHAH